MQVKITLLSDAIFGSGRSVPGMEDIGVLNDYHGFPYFSGSNLKGNLREALENICAWDHMEPEVVNKIFGTADKKGLEGETDSQIYISDFELLPEIREAVLKEYDCNEDNAEDNAEVNRQRILELFTELRTFTKLEDNVAKAGSLRTARCIVQNMAFVGCIECKKEYEALIKEGLGLIKWLGSMRSRGFGKVRIEVL